MKARVAAGKLVYMGASAGAIVAGDTAETANFKNWKEQGDDLVQWQNMVGVNLRWSPDALSVVGLGLEGGSLRQQVVCSKKVAALAASSGGNSSCHNLTGLRMVPIGVYPHLSQRNALDFAVGAVLSKEARPVVALPNDVAVVQDVQNGAGMRFFVPGCRGSLLVSTPLDATFDSPTRTTSARNCSADVPAVTFAGTTWIVEPPECSNGTGYVAICECFPGWPAQST